MLHLIPQGRVTTLRTAAVLLARAIVVSVAGFGCYVLAVILADQLLSIRAGNPVDADVIVMLGGDAQARALGAIALYHAGAAPRVLIAGQGDCTSVQPSFLEAGVPQAAILSECASETTWENAKFSAPILKQWQVRRAILVTSSFHMRRALACFRAASPEVAWATVPVTGMTPLHSLVLSMDGTRVAREFIKLAFYAIRYGISMWPDTGPSPPRT